MNKDTPPAAAKKTMAAKRPTAEAGDGHQEAVRHRAYLLYVERGCIAGYEVEDWLRAEALVSEELAAPAPPVKAAQAAAKPAPAKTAAKPKPASTTAKVATAPAAARKRAPAKARSE